MSRTHCDTTAARLMDDAVERMRDWWKNTGLGRWTRPVYKKASNYIKEMGPTGEEISRGLNRVSNSKERRLGVYKDRRNEIFRGMSQAQRVQAAQVADGHLSPDEVPAEVARAAQRFREEVLDDIMRTAQFLDGYRVVNGERVPIRGTGRAFPTLLNQRGRDFLGDLRGEETGSPRVIEWAERSVEQGRYESVDEALVALRKKSESDLRGWNPYLEDVRVHLDPEYREWDPTHGQFDRWLDQQSTHLEAAREWGWDLEQLWGMTTRMATEIGDPAAVQPVESYLRFQFGIPGQSDKAVSRLHSQFRSYLNFRIFGGTVIGPLRNAGQPYTNATDVPISAHFKTLREYPPVLGRFVREGDALRRRVLRSGGAPAEHPLFTWGPETHLSRMKDWSERSTFIHRRVIGNNEYRSAVMGMYGLQANVARLMQLQGESSPLMRPIQALRHLAIDPEAATRRAIERQGISSERLSEIIAQGGRLSESDMATAIQRASLDTQFGYTLATKPITFGTNPTAQTLFFLKNWAVRQTEFIYERVIRELANGNGKPMAKFLAATFFLGEVYNTSRDIITGSERSFTMNTLHNPSNDDEVAVSYRIMRNIADGGGLGLVQDVMWGLGNFIGGPAAGTLSNLGRAAAHVIQAPKEADTATAYTGEALWDLLDSEFVVSQQARGLWMRTADAVKGDTRRYWDYHAIRGRTFEQMDREEWGDTGMMGMAENVAMDAIHGRGRRAPGPRTLTYEGMQRAIVAEDPGKAADMAARALKGARDSDEYWRIVQGIEQSMRQRAPLGALSQDQQSEYLWSLDPEQREFTQRVQREWEEDVGRAIAEARQRVQPPYQ